EKFRGFTFVNESSIDDHFQGRQLDKMDEDEEDWENLEGVAKRERRRSSFGSVDGHGQRMSGVQKTGDAGDEGLFNHDFDMGEWGWVGGAWGAASRDVEEEWYE